MTTPAFCPSCGLNLRKDEVIERDGFVLDPRGYAVFSGRPIGLTRGEALILYGIAAAGERPINRVAIASKCGEQDDPAAVASVLVHRIRRHLADAHIPCPIRTVQGSGYRWEVPA